MNSQEALETGYGKPLQTRSFSLISSLREDGADSRLYDAGRAKEMKAGQLRRKVETWPGIGLSIAVRCGGDREALS